MVFFLLEQELCFAPLSLGGGLWEGQVTGLGVEEEREEASVLATLVDCYRKILCPAASPASPQRPLRKEKPVWKLSLAPCASPGRCETPLLP